MKPTIKLLSLLLCFAMLLTFASCSAEGEDSYAPMQPEKLHPTYSESDEMIGDGQEDEGYENPFVSTEKNNVSTFSADVDTASYSYFRKLVNSGFSLRELQNASSAFRTEEFINYFDYNVAGPDQNELFGTTARIIPCPWNTANVLLTLTLQAEDAVESAGNNLVFLIDVSGSMASSDKLPLLKKAFTTLVGQLSPRDTVSIVTYSGKEEVVLSGCPGNESARILDAINSLEAKGSTNGEAGLSRAYQVAEANMIEGGNNRIIMASDGDLNVGISSAEELKAFVEGKRDAGVFLSVLGFGTGNYRDGNMEALADNGNGVYYYIDGESEAEKVFGSDLLGTLYTVAKDVKLQLTFDRSQISSWRLIGYENRLLNKEDFEDDTKDAGEVGAGHQVTVCYELTLCEGATQSSSPWMRLDIRHKKPEGSTSLLTSYEIGAASLVKELDADTRFLSSVIQTVMLLRESRYLGSITLESILSELATQDLSSDNERAEFYQLLLLLSDRA